MNKLTVIDFFCGAGGFSEGFRQSGFNVIKGYDNWRPAIETFNHNFGLNSKTKNILDFQKSIEEIENIPDTDIIIGSPPCVSFSSSNKSGQADKSLGVQLTETFLKIVAVKKHQPNSMLKAWFMENVVNSKRYLQTTYTFKDLGLTDWAKKLRISPNKIAIDLYENSKIINSADYGSYQARKRIISGELIKKQKLIIPIKTHSPKGLMTTKPYNSLKKIKENFPSPFDKENSETFKDIQYDITLTQKEITDHFYDTGVYLSEWRFSKYYKVNHPFMGKMSFPENEGNPSRTITATKIANSRESILYKSEFNRKGNGEYRLPTVREAAIIMGFPITYQFLGSESTKWRLVGNAVCCAVSRAFAKVVLIEYGIKYSNELHVIKSSKINGINNLNNYKLKTFNNPPQKKEGSRFRRHVIKDGNLTVTLSNYDIENNTKTNGTWFTSVQYGNGKGFPIQNFENSAYIEIENVINEQKGGKEFISIINNGFSNKASSSRELQFMYERQKSKGKFLEPTKLVDEIGVILNNLAIEDTNLKQNNPKIFKYKDEIPLKQLFTLYAINKISTIANSK